MKFAALLGVKDEVELIGACVAQLRNIGVDQIVVSDYGSTDGTLDILADEQRAGDLVLESVDVSTIADFDSWSIRETALAESTRADWVLFLDADEFWIPASGSLRDCGALLEADVLTVDRFNVALTAHQQAMPVGAWLKSNDELLLYTTMPGDFLGFVEAHPEVPFITLMPGPKVMARPHMIAGVEPGSHDVTGRSADPTIRRYAAPDLLIAHVAFSTAERFWRKLDNIRLELAQNPAYFNGELSWHWKRWAAMTDDALAHEFARQMLDDTALSLLRDRGVVRSAEEIFAERMGEELVASEAERVRLREELVASEAEQGRLREELVGSEAKQVRLREELVASEAEQVRLREELVTLEDERARLEATINQIIGSRGWRLLERARGARRLLS